MIELTLPFKEAKPKFPYTRGIALKHTENALKSMRKDPKFFQKTLDKFSINVDRETPRFEPVPPKHRYNKDGYAYYIPQFSVKQKGKARMCLTPPPRLMTSESTTPFVKVQTVIMPYGVLYKGSDVTPTPSRQTSRTCSINLPYLMTKEPTCVSFGSKIMIQIAP